MITSLEDAAGASHNTLIVKSDQSTVDRNMSSVWQHDLIEPELNHAGVPAMLSSYERNLAVPDSAGRQTCIPPLTVSVESYGEGIADLTVYR